MRSRSARLYRYTVVRVTGPIIRKPTLCWQVETRPGGNLAEYCNGSGAARGTGDIRSLRVRM